MEGQDPRLCESLVNMAVGKLKVPATYSSVCKPFTDIHITREHIYVYVLGYSILSSSDIKKRAVQCRRTNEELGIKKGWPVSEKVKNDLKTVKPDVCDFPNTYCTELSCEQGNGAEQSKIQTMEIIFFFMRITREDKTG